MLMRRLGVEGKQKRQFVRLDIRSIIVVAIVVVVMQGGRRGTSKLSDGSLARGNTIEYETSAST